MLVLSSELEALKIADNAFRQTSTLPDPGIPRELDKHEQFFNSAALATVDAYHGACKSDFDKGFYYCLILRFYYC